MEILASMAARLRGRNRQGRRAYLTDGLKEFLEDPETLMD